MKGYKAFSKGLICRGKQYQENTVFEEDKARICVCGMHFCSNPIETLDYYPVVDDEGELTEFAEVEALDECQSDMMSHKYSTKKLKIGRKLGLAEFIEACIDFSAKQGTFIGGIASLASALSNTYVMQQRARNAAAFSGWRSRLVQCGNCASCAVAGDESEVISSGDYYTIATSGAVSRIASSGEKTQIASSGYKTRCVSTGNEAVIAASGDNTFIDMRGQDSIGAVVGAYGMIRGSLGSWITLAEWGLDDSGFRGKCKCVKSAQIDGEKLKPDTWYRLVDGEFTEVEIN